MPTLIHLPAIPDAERTALVELIEALAEHNQRQAETIQQLRDEIAVLKGEKAKPQFKPSGMATRRTRPRARDRGNGRARPNGTRRRS